MNDEDRAEEYRAGWIAGADAGRADMLRRVLDEAETFKGLMKRRRYFNNAAGVGRFAEYLKARLGEVTE